MLINSRDIQAFIAVVETGSIVAAAGRLHITQPGVTRRIQSLEAALGSTLLDRQSKPLKPTAAGRQAYELGRRVVRSVEDLTTGVAPGNEIAGEFRIGISSWLAESVLTKSVDELHAHFPRLSVRAVVGWSPGILEQVEANTLDAAVLFLPTARELPETIAGQRLATWPSVIIAGRKVKLPNQPSMRGLSVYPWVLNPDGCGFRRAIQRTFEARQLPFNIAVEASSPDLQLSLIARGIGLGLISPCILSTSTFRHLIRTVEIPEFRFEMNIWFVHRQEVGRLAEPISSVLKVVSGTLRNIESTTSKQMRRKNLAKPQVGSTTATRTTRTRRQ